MLREAGRKLENSYIIEMITHSGSVPEAKYLPQPTAE
jgi:hypothetical protein